jgi:hypothetical protein
MTTLYRPAYAEFDASRPAALSPRSSGSYHRLGNLANEAILARTATRFIRASHQAGNFAEICTR